ncbi:S-adenosyl-L-methionine-dependent methyltransferase [Boeremia exigua]|uniref:S-adenosyl-L-methionine-dependent methyltransferase n=1 Tax=Boeremia exigua TaxID=749465 RepID=UPI001E8DADD7|nr:S-adenosyl-L-methionine-dependent methyltransferase [Boeremia exigua]KAH6611941.1 S-adenosyl-L-methionine-dependent methyltransferase [Boeremia exigua]
MPASKQAQEDYDRYAAIYDDYSLLPSGRLESDLIKIALGDCTGLTILDLGGGTALHAREAISLGAKSIDVVDVSSEMLAEGCKCVQDKDSVLAQKLRFFQADVSKPLSHLPLCKEGYDLVMANWIFSFADTMEVLEGMFRNIVGYLKPGGRFIGVRDADPWSPALESKKYGGYCEWLKDIPGGVQYLCVLNSSPPIKFIGSSLEVIYSGSTEIYEKFGLTEISLVPYEEAEVIRQDRRFWELFLDRPNMAVVRAIMKA